MSKPFIARNYRNEDTATVICRGEKEYTLSASNVAENQFFYFEVKNVGESEIVAKAGEYTDCSKICKVD